MTPDTEDIPGSKRLTAYYDGSCPLCQAEIAHYRSQTGADKISFVDVSLLNAETGEDLSRMDAMRRFHVRREDGTLVSGAKAFAEIWTRLPKWKWAASVARMPAMTGILEGIYRLFLPIRPTVSKAFARLQPRHGK